jgi:uncharacterized membrane protein YphA (DoxX/SURF4 family)
MKAAAMHMLGKQNDHLGVTAWLSTVLRIALSVIFILAGLYKLRDLSAFEVSLIHWQLFPDQLVAPLMWGIPFLEIVAGWACLPTRSRQAALRFLFFLTGAYTVLIAVEWARGISFDCGCFGTASAHWPYYALVLRNVGLILIEILLIDFSTTRQIPPAVVSRIPGGP